MDVVTYSQLRQNLKNILDMSVDRHEPVLIKRQHGDDMVLVSLRDYRAMEETVYLLRSPANASRLMASLEESLQGKVKSKPLFDEDK